MRRALAMAAVLSACLLPSTAHADEPLICYETGEVWVEGVGTYDPPNPCLL